MAVTINQKVRELIIIKGGPTAILEIKEKASPSVISIVSKGPRGPQGEGVDDSTDFLMYYKLSKG